MTSNMKYIRQLPSPEELKEAFPLTEEIIRTKQRRDKEIADVFTGKDDRFLLIIGPCSADREDAVLEYMNRLAGVQEKVKDKILMIPRVYTNKPRTKGVGYKGMFHQPDPHKKEDMLKGIIAIRQLHSDVIKQTGFTCADEMLYPDNYAYLNDVLAYVAIGARSVEDQQHRIVASGVDIPCGMKNPTGGDLSVMMNAISAAQVKQKFVYRGWEVETEGNPLAHVIMRGYVDRYNHSHSNYHYEDLMEVKSLYHQFNLENPAVIVDCNHNNSGKKFMEQIRIAKDVIHSMKCSDEIRELVKGVMIESYLVDGAQKPEETVYGKSITDPCLGWKKTEQLIYELAEEL